MTQVGVSRIDISSFPAVKLTAEREAWLLTGLVAALPRLKMAELFAVRRDMFREADMITVATDVQDGTAVAALSSRWKWLPSGRRLLHILAQFVGDDHRQGVAFRRSWADHFIELGSTGSTFPDLIVLKTYNPIAYCAMHRFSRIPGVTMYPDVSGGEQDASTVRLAIEVAGVVAAGHPFEPATGVIRDAGVPRDLYPALPVSSNRAVNTYFETTTRPGDRVLAMLTVPTVPAADAILAALSVARA